MTCIVALTDGKDVHMAGDLMAHNGFTGNVLDKSKVFIKEGFIVGYTTSFRMGQILEYAWTPPSKKESQTEDSYIYIDIVNSFREVFSQNGYGNKDGIEDHSGEFIFGYKGRLFLHQQNYSILESNSFVATGSGGYHAEAAIATMLKHGVYEGEYECLLGSAIEVASSFVSSVSRELTYKVLKGEY